MVENKYGFELRKTILENTKNIDFKAVTPMYINQLALKTKLENESLEKENMPIDLLSVLYITCAIDKKIKKALQNAYIPYCSYEDFVSIFFLTVQKCLKEYNSDIGDFQNFVNKQVEFAFKNEKKSSFLKVTGNISKEDRKDFFSEDIESYSLGTKSAEHNDTELKLMNELLFEKINAIKDGYLMIYKYTKSDKPISNEQLGRIFGLSEKQVRLRLKNVSDTFRLLNNSFFDDYFYDTNNLETNICVKCS